MATPTSLVDRLRRRVGQMVLAGEGHDDATWEAAGTSALPPSSFEGFLTDAAQTVAAYVAAEKPHLLSALWVTGTAASVPGALAVVSVERSGAEMEGRPFRGAALRPPAAPSYVLADGRLVTTDGGAADVTVVRAPADAGEVPEVLHEAVVEEAAALCFIALGGDAPSAQGRASDALERALA